MEEKKDSGFKLEGVSVKEIEQFISKYTSEMFIILTIFFAYISSHMDWVTGSKLSLLVCGICLILGVIFSTHCESLLDKVHDFLKKQDRMVKVVIGIFRVIVGIFLPWAVFGVIGLHAGVFYKKKTTVETTSQDPPK